MTLGFKSRGSEFIDRKSTLAFVIPAQSLPDAIRGRNPGDGQRPSYR